MLFGSSVPNLGEIVYEIISSVVVRGTDKEMAAVVITIIEECYNQYKNVGNTK